MRPYPKELVCLVSVLGLCASSHALSFSWDNASPVFVRPSAPFVTTYGYLVGTVVAESAETITHYSFANAYNSANHALAVGFASEHSAWNGIGTYHGRILRFELTSLTDLGLYDQNPFGPNPPFLQFHDQTHNIHSGEASFSFTVVPEPASLLLLSPALVLLRRRSRR